MSASRDVPEGYPTFPTRAPLDTQEDGEDYSSSNVHSLLYDFGERELIARYYRDGADALYRYPNFPAQMWSSLAAASSKGRFINLEIRNQFAFDRLRISRYPQKGRGIEHPVARRFVTAPISTADVAHPHQP